MSGVVTSVERLVSRWQVRRYEEQQRVSDRLQRDVSERVQMGRSGIVLAGSRPTSL